jgi:hypothetical protein
MRFFIILISLVFLSPFQSFPWGFLAHQQINRLAVFSLPAPMLGFFKYHSDYISSHAVDPDKRRYAVEGEAACHYIDLDRYGLAPFDSIPEHWRDAVALFSEDTLMAHGIVPWHVVKTYHRLLDAFQSKDVMKILRYASDLGHYVGDAHVPLHCTSNYNGQFTNQHGIHGLWESRIPELSMHGYSLVPGRCSFVSDPLDAIWNVIKQSHQALDSVFLFERLVTKATQDDMKFNYELRGSNAVKVYAANFALQYEQVLDGMVERRMESSIRLTASLWYSAWVMAGQPDLDALTNWTPSPSQIEKQRQELDLIQRRTLQVPEHDH